MSNIEIKKIGITKLDADCIVNAANSMLQAGGGVCGAIFSEAGMNDLQQACDKYGKCETGSAVITPGFRLKAKYIIHAVGPVWHGGYRNEPQLLSDCYWSAMCLARDNGCHSIGFPLISSGIFGYPKKEAWQVAINAVGNFLDANRNYDINVTFCVLSEEMYAMGEAVLGMYMNRGIEASVKPVLFWMDNGENGYLSNWYHAPFTLDDFIWDSTEQYFMAQKAKYFHDAKQYTNILKCSTAKEAKEYGRQVNPFNGEIWASVSYEVMKRANRAKFQQNPKLMNKLINTGDAVLAEASPHDSTWGLGVDADSASKIPMPQWTGKNLMGKILMELRKEFSHSDSETNPIRSFMDHLDEIYADDDLWEKYQKIVRKEFSDRKSDFFAFHRDDETKEIWKGLIENMGGGVPLSFFEKVDKLL